MSDINDMEQRIARHRRLAQVFTPNAPVSNKGLFRGRLAQILKISTAIEQPGQHVVLYGERGVGKTSLATLLAPLLDFDGGMSTPTTARINCTTQDTFRHIWTKVFREMHMSPPQEWEERRPDPDDLRWAFSNLPSPRLIVLDEFDRVEDDDTLSLMADTLKALSDHHVRSKVVVVGVADSIDQLFGEHESVQRAVEEVHMPRMSTEELTEIINEGLAAADMSVSGPARTQIARLAEGLPHYAHLLTLHAGQRAAMAGRLQVETEDVDAAISEAVQRHSLGRDYQMAIQSPRPDNLFSRVLAACALADKNRLGYFTAAAVREPMSRIMGKPYSIPAFAPHLNAFTESDRGWVLRKDGTPRKYVYRFRNPLLQPFAIFAALDEGVIPADYKNDLFGGRTIEDASSESPPLA